MPEDSRETDPDPAASAVEAVRVELMRYAADLVPNAVGELSRQWGPLAGRLAESHRVAEKVALLLAMPAYVGFLRPGFAMPRTGTDALRAALARHADILRPRASAELMRLWAPIMAHLPPERVAGLVVQKLSSPAGAAYLGGTEEPIDPSAAGD